MTRRLLASLFVTALAFALTAQADTALKAPKAKPGTKADEGPKVDSRAALEEAKVRQAQLKRQFEAFKQKLLVLAGRLENGSDQDKEKAKALRNALRLAGDQGVEVKFDALIRGLGTKGADKNNDVLEQLLKDNKDLREDLKKLIALLARDDREALKEQREKTARLLEQLKELIAKQERVRALTEMGRKSSPDLKRDQSKVTRETKAVIDPKKKDDKPGAGKSGTDSKGKGEAKGGKPGEKKAGSSGSGKPGEGKPGQGEGSGKPGSGSGKPGQGKPSGGGKSGQPGDQQPNDNPVKKQIQDANKYQKQAEDDLDKDKKDDATDKQTKAIKELEAAKKKLEDLLKQMREEEIERLLAALEQRCRYMLALQIEVRDATVSLDKEIQKTADKKPTLAHGHKSNQQADKEETIIKEADAALKILEGEGSAVAFAEVFQQVKKDMEVVKNRLTRTDVGKVTVTIENDIIETLKEMIEALKKAQKDAKSPPPGKPKPSQSGMPQDQKLIDLLAELKMIYAMQRRVNARTQLYGKQYKGEQAPAPATAPNAKEREHYEMIQKELKDLAGRQEKIGKVTRDIATGKNEAK